MNNQLVYLFCMCDLLREIENQCTACPKLCQSAGITLLTKATPTSSEQQRQQSKCHKEAMSEQEPTLLYFPGHHDREFW